MYEVDVVCRVSKVEMILSRVIFDGKSFHNDAAEVIASKFQQKVRKFTLKKAKGIFLPYTFTIEYIVELPFRRIGYGVSSTRPVSKATR